MEKYFLMENYDIVESEIFINDEFLIEPADKEGIYEVKIIEHKSSITINIDIAGKPGPHSVGLIGISPVGTVIMESDDYESLELFKRLRGH